MILAAGQMTTGEELRLLLIELLIGVALAIPCVIVVRRYVHPRFPKASHALRESTRQVRWPYYAAGAGFFLSSGAHLWHLGQPVFGVYFVCLGLFQLAAMIRSIYRHRSQWSIKGLLIATLIVAICCSLLTIVGWPMMPVLAGLFGTAALLLFCVAVFRRRQNQVLHPPEDDHDTASQ